MGEGTLSPVKPPKPDLVVVGNGQCHSISKWLESLGNIWGVPVILIDTPFGGGERYVEEEIKEFIDFLESFCGKRLDYYRLCEVVDTSRRMFTTWRDILKLRKARPSPMSVFDIYTNLFPILGLRGREEGALYYEELKREVEERVRNKVGAVPDERIRLHVHGVPVWYKLRDMYEDFAKKGANPITHLYPLVFSFYDLDPERPIESLARCISSSWLNRDIKERAEVLARLSEEYSLDGFVLQMTRTCKACCAGAYDMGEEVKRLTGKPYLAIETDMCDPRFHNDAQVKRDIETFLETLA